jgi:hypothetical protein
MSVHNTSTFSFFDTITQYDNKYDKLWEDNPNVSKGVVCPYFSLITAEKFFKNGLLTKEAHENNLNVAIDTFILLDDSRELTFEELVAYTDLDKKDIMCTTSELINMGEFSLKELFTNNSSYPYYNYAIMFLKNAKFFVVLCDHIGYHIRDCHESFQYSFYKLDELIDHLNKIYQFNITINLDGVEYCDYSSIEYIRIDRKINSVLRNVIKYQFEDASNDELENTSLIDYIDTDESHDYILSDESE